MDSVSFTPAQLAAVAGCATGRPSAHGTVEGVRVTSPTAGGEVFVDVLVRTFDGDLEVWVAGINTDGSTAGIERQ